MPDSVTQVPVPFYPPARIGTGDAGPFNNTGQPSRRMQRVDRQQWSAVSNLDQGLIYNQKGLWSKDLRLGWNVNVWV